MVLPVLLNYYVNMDIIETRIHLYRAIYLFYSNNPAVSIQHTARKCFHRQRYKHKCFFSSHPAACGAKLGWSLVTRFAEWLAGIASWLFGWLASEEREKNEHNNSRQLMAEQMCLEVQADCLRRYVLPSNFDASSSSTKILNPGYPESLAMFLLPTNMHLDFIYR